MKTHYYNWVVHMQVILQARDMCLTVSVENDDYTEDRMALEILTKAVPPELMGTIANKAMTKIAWDSLHLHNVNVECVRKAHASTLW
jgi:hypothetical protein